MEKDQELLDLVDDVDQNLNTPFGGDYVEVRGVHPTYINGFVCLELTHHPRGITLQAAREIANAAIL